MNSFLTKLRADLDKLPFNQKVLFCLLTSEKLLPNYRAFQNKYRWGNYKVLQNIIDELYVFLLHPATFKKNEFSSFIEKIEFVTPHTEDFPGILSSFALDCCTSVEGTLNFIMDEDIEHVVYVASYAYDTVDMFVQEINDLDSSDPDLELKILADDFMKREISRQINLVKRLKDTSQTVLTDQYFASLREKTEIIDLTLCT